MHKRLSEKKIMNEGLRFAGVLFKFGGNLNGSNRSRDTYHTC